MLKRSPFVALVLLAALAGGLALPPRRSGAQGRKGGDPRPDAAADPAAPPAARADSFQPSASLLIQIEALKNEKSSRTPAQRKLDSQLIYALKERRGDSIKGAVPQLRVGAKVDERGRTLVDIRAVVTKRVLAAIRQAGGEVVSYFKREQSIRADLPVDSLELIAAMSEVRFIRPAEEFMLHKAEAPAGGGAGTRGPGTANPTPPAGRRPGFAGRAAAVRERLAGALFGGRAASAAADDAPALNVGTATSEGDATHNARLARNFFGVNGKGIRIGIISDSFNAGGGYDDDIASGNLPGPGNPFGHTTPVVIEQDSPGTDEGRAMAQIVHDLVPGAALYFATANGGVANFAQNILDLRNTHGCDIIVDDVSYFSESPFQNDAIGNAVDAVMAGGGLYFSSVGNSGNLNDNTSGVWEGDYADSGTLAVGTLGTLQHVHDFDPAGGVAQSNAISSGAGNPVTLYWSDPLGASNNDYDLYILNSAGTDVIAASTSDQSGTQNPFEVTSGGNTTNNRVVIEKFSGAGRFLHLDVNRGRLTHRTAGQARGHAATSAGYAVAASPAVGPFPSAFSSANVVEPFSSDGPRRVYYQGNGAEITPGDRSSTGGAVRQKPEITAADGVSTTVAGFSAFFGTSAAAPHAAAIAALLKSSSAAPTAAQILAALNATAIDIEAAGPDRDSGVGIVMPYPALQHLGAAPGATLDLGAATATPTSGCDAAFGARETGALTVNLSNLGGGTATAVSASLSPVTPGVTVIQSASVYPDIGGGGNAGNLQPFTFVLPNSFLCGGSIKFTLSVAFAGGQASPLVLPVTVATSATTGGATTTNYGGAPVAIPDGNAAGVNIPLAVSGFSGGVADLNFRVGGSACNAAAGATTNGINHPWVGDLVLKLTSPQGTTVTIVNRAGGVNNSGNNYCNTVLDDDAAGGSIQSIAPAQNPFTGTFKPANPLSAFDGENPNGTWTLNVVDAETPDAGNLTAFGLDITPFTCAAAPATSIAGRIVTAGAGPLPGVTVRLTGSETQTTTTNGAGDYLFVLPTCGGVYTVTPSRASHTFNPPRQTFVNPAGGQTADFSGTAAVTPSGAAPGQVVISEFRARGAAGALDEFVEIANRTDAPITVGASDGASAGWLLAALDGGGASSTPVYTIPNGTVIPARGRFLVANGGGYTLGDYAPADAYSTADIPDNTGLALFDSGTTAGAVLDAAGFNAAAPGFADTYREGGGMPPVGTTNGQYSLVRSLAAGSPRDTNSNADDFILVAPDAGLYGGRQSRLGAPGPENLAGPVNRNDRIKASLIDIAQPSGAAPNVVRDFAGYADALTPTTAGVYTAGTLSIRRRFTNQTGNSVSRVRFRVVDATAGPAPGGTADLRVLSSPDLVVSVSSTNCALPPCAVSLAGLTLEQPATQAAGGGLNSTVAAGTITPGTPLAPGASLNVEFRLGVRQAGAFHFFITVEALP